MLFKLEISLSGTLGKLLNSFIEGVPSFISAIVVIILGMIIARVVANLVKKGLQGIGVDKLGEKLNAIDFVDKANVNIKISTVLSKVFYYVIILMFAAGATDILQMPALSNMVSDAITFIPNLIVALIWLVVGILLADALKNIVQTACESVGIPSAKLISTLLFYFVLINVIISALAQAKINTEFLEQNISLVIGGIVLAFSIGYGFASKDSVSNYLGSFYSKNKFQVGDTISVLGSKGEIVEMDNSTVTLNTGKSTIVMPLSKLSSEVVEIL